MHAPYHTLDRVRVILLTKIGGQPQIGKGLVMKHFDEASAAIVHDPGLIDQARDYPERAMAPDPRQSRYVAMRRALPGRPAADVASAPTEDGERGQLPRDTAPVTARNRTGASIR